MFGRNSVATNEKNGLFYYYESLYYQEKKRPIWGKVFVVLKMQQYFSGEIKPNQQFVIENTTYDEYHMSETAIAALLHYLLSYPEGPLRPVNSMLYDSLILNAETSVVKWWREVLERGFHCTIADLIDGNELTCSRFIQLQGNESLSIGRKDSTGINEDLDPWIREISQKDLYHRYKKDLSLRGENPVFNVQFWERMKELCQIISQRKSKGAYVSIKHRITPTRGKISTKMKNGKRATAVLKYIILPTHEVAAIKASMPLLASIEASISVGLNWGFLSSSNTCRSVESSSTGRLRSQSIMEPLRSLTYNNKTQAKMPLDTKKNMGGSGTIRNEKSPFRKIGWLDNSDCHKKIKAWCREKYSPQVGLILM